MHIKSAQFVISNVDYKNCPKQHMPEYAFIGRSNVGKSSLINMLTGRKGLAKTSGTPGKTQLINHFIINDKWYLVDLPGFGYAKTSKSKRQQWQTMISDYLLHRKNLLHTFILIDSRIETQKIDIEFINWMGQKQLPFTIVFTKTDKLKKRQLTDNLNAYKTFLSGNWDELPPMIISSARNLLGKQEILEKIIEVNKIFKSD